jgi:hypothetical protein
MVCNLAANEGLHVSFFTEQPEIQKKKSLRWYPPEAFLFLRGELVPGFVGGLNYRHLYNALR